MQYNIEKTQNPKPIEKLQDDITNLQKEVRRLEIQVATLFNADAEKSVSGMEAWETPHTASDKFQRCKNCKYMRLPHKSNAHYTCNVRRATIEPTWTCQLFYDKNNQRI